MTRWLTVVLLLLLNLAFAAWHQGLLGRWGLAPHSEREPERLAQQIRPEALRLTAPASAPANVSANAPATAPASEPASGPASAATPTASPSNR
jgi:hypothetical protein